MPLEIEVMMSLTSALLIVVVGDLPDGLMDGVLVDGASFACISRVEMCDMLSASGSSESLYASLILNIKSELSMDAVSLGSVLLESLLLGDDSAGEDPVETLSSSLIMFQLGLCQMNHLPTKATPAAPILTTLHP